MLINKLAGQRPLTVIGIVEVTDPLVGTRILAAFPGGAPLTVADIPTAPEYGPKSAADTPLPKNNAVTNANTIITASAEYEVR